MVWRRNALSGRPMLVYPEIDEGTFILKAIGAVVVIWGILLLIDNLW